MKDTAEHITKQQGGQKNSTKTKQLKREKDTIRKERAPGPLQKGGVPAAPSGTATLLRLSPNHRYRPRPRLDGDGLQAPPTFMA